MRISFLAWLSVHSIFCPAATLDLSQYKGKVVYVDFWASWCKPCLKSFPWMIKLEKQFSGKNFIIITVNEDTDQNLALQFLKHHPLNAEAIFDIDNAIATQFNIRAIPSSFIYNAEGQIAGTFSGFNEKNTRLIEEKIIHLLD